MQRGLTIERTESLNFSTTNPNRGSVPDITISIKEFGFLDCIVAVGYDGERRIIAGEHRLKGAIECGVEFVPVFWADMEGAEADAYMLADNAIASHSVWDVTQLAELGERFESFSGLPFENVAELVSFAEDHTGFGEAAITIAFGDFTFSVSAAAWAAWEEDLRYEAADNSTDAVTIIKNRVGLL